MPRTGITYSDVAAAAEAITAAGVMPTIERIRQRLGGGNNTNIGNHLKVWKKSVAQQGMALPTPGLPAVLTKAVQELYHTINYDTDKRVAQLEEETRATVATFEQSLVEARQENSGLLAQVKALQDDNFNLQQAKQDLTKQVTLHEHTIALLTEKHHGLKAQLDEQQAENARLYAFGQHIQHSLTHYQDEQQKLQAQEALAQQNMLFSHAQEVKELREQLLQANTLQQQWQLQAEALAVKHSALSSDYEKTQAQTHELTEQVTQQTLTIEHLQQRLADRLTTQQQQNATYQEMTAQLAIAQHEQQRLAAELKQANGTIQLLRQDKLVLAQAKGVLEGQLTTLLQTK